MTPEPIIQRTEGERLAYVQGYEAGANRILTELDTGINRSFTESRQYLEALLPLLREPEDHHES